MSLVSALNMVWRAAGAGRCGQSSTLPSLLPHWRWWDWESGLFISDAGLERGTVSHRDSGDI